MYVSISVKFNKINQVIVGSVMINIELCRENFSSIPAITFERGLKLFDAKIKFRIRLNW
jgi:hypothetical protein